MDNTIIKKRSAVTYCAITDNGSITYWCVSKKQYKAIKRASLVTIANIGKDAYKSNYKTQLNPQTI